MALQYLSGGHESLSLDRIASTMEFIFDSNKNITMCSVTVLFDLLSKRPHHHPNIEHTHKDYIGSQAIPFAAVSSQSQELSTFIGMENLIFIDLISDKLYTPNAII